MTAGDNRKIGRRDLLRGSLLAGGALLSGFDRVHRPAASKDQGLASSASASGKLVGIVPFSEEARVPMDTAFGAELDGRLYTDLSTLSSENPITPVERFYIRTRASKLLDEQKPWLVSVGAGTAKPFALTIEELERTEKPMGLHLMECSGNARSMHFGMISVAEWAGTPLSDILERANPKPDARRVLISGFDTYATKSASSIPGASWIFTADELNKARAFLATKMNGAPLTRDHGAPVRLMVPGWYGCTCIKWVNKISFVDETAAATSQMQEYASRTMQNGAPQIAREYAPATLEQAAMPIRIEKWASGEKIQYGVVGIAWGGTIPASKLQIRFNPEEDYVDVRSYKKSTNDAWTFWTHTWAPKQPGTYMIRLHFADTGVVARRLEAGYYMRSVEISEI